MPAPARGIALGLALAWGIGCKGGPEMPTREEALASTAWKPLFGAWKDGDPLPDFLLVDQAGRPFQLGELASSYVLLGFVFTRCGVPEACPLTMRKMREVRDLFAEREARGEMRGRSLRLLTVTLDPEFDTPEILAAYGPHYGVDGRTWRLATGPPELVATALPMLFNVLALPDPSGTLGHTVKVALCGPGLRPLVEWTDNAFTAQQVVARILD